MRTKKLYDIDAYLTEFEAKVLSCTKVEPKETDTVSNCLYEVILDQTAFFPEEGGQTPDKGTLGDVDVVDVQIKNHVITHILTKPLEEGASIKGKINWQHRFFNMQQHSGEHLFSGYAFKKYGYTNVGFHLSNQIVTMDFDGTFTPEQLEEMEWLVNEAIIANVEVKTGYPTQEELETLTYRSKLDLTEDVRIVEMGQYDICACCAPHVKRTGEIGFFKIQYAQNYKGGTRISFLCGFRALTEYRQKSQIISELTNILTTNQENLPWHVSKLKTQLQSVKTQLANAKQELMLDKIKTIPREQRNVILFENDLDTPVMRHVVNALVENHQGVCGVFVGTEADGYTFIIGSKIVDCTLVAKELREKLNARGGGSKQMIQGSVSSQPAILERLLLQY